VTSTDDAQTARSPLGRRLFAEGLGTALLVAAVVGSGIMAQTLSPHDTGLALLENAVATGGVLFVLIATLGPVSGAHFNPVVTLVDAWFGGIARRDVAPYVVVQVVGACAGAILANLMFGLSAVSVSTHDRSGSGILLSEVVATFGLLLLILGLVRGGPVGVDRRGGRGVHRRGVLVHGVDVVREPRGDDRSDAVEHVRRYRPRERARVRGGPAGRRRARGRRHDRALAAPLHAPAPSRSMWSRRPADGMRRWDIRRR
jgi:hypothetical protein